VLARNEFQRENFVSKREICCTFTDKQQKETLHPHDVPDRPWAKIWTDFDTDWNIENVASLPTFAQSNWKAEQAVKIAKALMRKAKSEKHDPYLALLDFRNTPRQGMDSSPAQRLTSRRTKTLLQTSGNLLKLRVPAQVMSTDRGQQGSHGQVVSAWTKNHRELIASGPIDQSPVQMLVSVPMK